MLSSAVVLATIAAFVFVPAAAIAQAPGDPERGTLDGSPLDDLPPHISLLTDFGSRPDWSSDGERILFIDGAPLGDVVELDVATRTMRRLTDGFEHMGFTRAHYLPTGDLLLCGPTSGPLPSQDPDKPNPTFIEVGNEAAQWLAEKTGGYAQSVVLEAWANIPSTAHILGGAAIGADPSAGVVDARSRVFGYENLLICDGSTVPANPGVNPALTITAMSEHAMSHLPAAVQPSAVKSAERRFS